MVIDEYSGSSRDLWSSYWLWRTIECCLEPGRSCRRRFWQATARKSSGASLGVGWRSWRLGAGCWSGGSASSWRAPGPAGGAFRSEINLIRPASNFLFEISAICLNFSLIVSDHRAFCMSCVFDWSSDSNQYSCYERTHSWIFSYRWILFLVAYSNYYPWKTIYSWPSDISNPPPHSSCSSFSKFLSYVLRCSLQAGSSFSANSWNCSETFSRDPYCPCYYTFWIAACFASSWKLFP